MEDMVGFGFRPTDDELVGFYLRNQIEGNTRLVEKAIAEVNICKFDPWNLRFQSKIKPRDRVWYFFSRRENKYANGTRQNRRTSSGFWKLTGESVDVKDQWGFWSGFRGRIGHKRCLVFLKGRGSEKTTSDWVMHEFHYDLLPEHKRTYVICRLEYKGDDKNILFDFPTDSTPTLVANATNSEGSVVNRSFQEISGSFYYPSEYYSENQGQQFQQEVPNSDSYVDNSQMIWDYEIIRNLEFLIDEKTIMQANRSNHCPKTPVTGLLADDSSDSETDSMTCRDTSSSTDSVVGSSNEPNHTLTYDIPSLNTIEPFHNYEARGQPKQPKLHLQGKQKVINMQKSECEWKMAEDSIKKTPSNNTVKHNWIVLEEMSQRNSRWSYLKNMIIGFSLLISIIGWIIVV